MATRRLPRVIVEGGRSNTYKSDVRNTYSQERHAVKSYCARARFDVEIGDTELDDRRRVPTSGCEKFADRLAPIYRWLEANNGRLWDDVYADLRRQVDIRTMKGWHYLDHVKKLVLGYGFRPRAGDDEPIDEDGRLNYIPYRKRNQGRRRKQLRPRPKKPTWTYDRWHRDAELKRVFRLRRVQRVPRFSTEPIDTLHVGRVVIERGATLYWGIPTAADALCLRCTNRHHLNICAHGHWRQTTALTSTERALWGDLPETVKQYVRWQPVQPLRW